MDDEERQYKQMLRDLWSLYLDHRRSVRRWGIGYAVVGVLLALIFLWHHDWETAVYILCMICLLIFVVPRVERYGRLAGWNGAWASAIKIVIDEGAPRDLVMEMMLRRHLGPPSDRANEDEARMRVRELDDELRES